MPYHTRTEERRIANISVTIGASCDQCHAGLEPVDSDESGAWILGPKNALSIHLVGGYGLYFDSDSDAHVLLCHSCANRLLDTFPCMLQAIKEAQGFE